MRRIKLSGRERAVLKALGFAKAIPGEQIREYTQIQPDDLTDVLNALLAAGYVESKPYREQVTSAEMPTVEFEVNPAYVHELKTRCSAPGYRAARFRADAEGAISARLTICSAGAILRAAFAEKLSNDIFDRQFLHVDIRDRTGAQNCRQTSVTFARGNFQLHADRCLLDHFAERRKNRAPVCPQKSG